MTVRIRLEALPADVTAALNWLKSTGARLTGVTRLYPNRNNAESRLYAVMSLPDGNGNSGVDRTELARQARAEAKNLHAAGDAVRAAYYSGLADGLEHGY